MTGFPDHRAFCDTSFFFASLSPKDTHYERAGEILAQALRQQLSFHTTWDVISETVTLLLYRFSAKAAVRFLDEVKPTLDIVYYDDSVRNEAKGSAFFAYSARTRGSPFAMPFPSWWSKRFSGILSALASTKISLPLVLPSFAEIRA
jgi:predicted nucleic acid-binding protein